MMTNRPFLKKFINIPNMKKTISLFLIYLSTTNLWLCNLYSYVTTKVKNMGKIYDDAISILKYHYYNFNGYN
jgi:hypothetical protein